MSCFLEFIEWASALVPPTPIFGGSCREREREREREFIREMTRFALDLQGHSKTLSHFPHCSNRRCKKTYQTSTLNSVDRYLKKPHEAPQNRPNELVTNHSLQDMINKQRMNCVVLSVHSCFTVAWRSLQGLNRNQSVLFFLNIFYKASISEQLLLLWQEF